MNKVHEEWVLSLPKAIKLMFVEDALRQGNTAMVLELSILFVEAPITEGGISVDELNELIDSAPFNTTPNLHEIPSFLL